MRAPKLRYTNLLGTVLGALLLGGCVSSDSLRKDAMEITREVAKGPAEAPFKAVTNFSSAVRCMDGLLQSYGIRDISILVEDLEDHTKKVSAGTKDMLLTTASDMTRRSRAIRFVAFGGDTKNARDYMALAQRASSYKNVPQYGIRGSISQFDDNVAKVAKDVGLGIGEFLTLGKSSSATSKIVAIDLTVIDLADFSVLPGVASKNGVAIFAQGDGTDAEARYKKFGINYATSLSRSEGTAVAIRNLVELAAVELMGKLTKVPYWTCLGASPNDPAIRAEVDDWFESMALSGKELFAWWQYQMYIRGTYRGDVDGVPTAAFADALRSYKVAMGRKADTDLNAEFLYTYLHTDHGKAMAAFEAARPVVTAVPPAATATRAELGLRGTNSRKHAPGEKVELELKTDGTGHAYCFLLDETQKVMRVHPNRFNKSSLVIADKPLSLPGTTKFSLVADRLGRDQVIECHVVAKEMFSALPANVAGADLSALSVRSLDEVRTAFATAVGGGNPLLTTRYTVSVERR